VRNVLVFLACFIAAAPLYADVRLSYLSGAVSLYHNNAWAPAQKGISLAEKDIVKTEANSRAVLQMDNGTRIWVGQNARMAITSAGNDNFFSLLAGKIRAKVKLLIGQKFQVRSPVAVASVRGTEFVMSSENELVVLEGTVDFWDREFKVRVEVGSGQIGVFTQAGTPEPPRNLTPGELQNINGEWQGFGSGQGGQDQNDGSGSQQQGQGAKDDLKSQNDELRREMHDIVGQVQTDLQVTRELTNEIKESDMSAGRTLRDVHGNLVRVEQHLLRPDSQTLEFLNLTKRSDYRYKGFWTYSGPAGSRLDVMDVKMKMNMSLPEQITEWPGYIASKGDDMHPEEVSVNISNQEDSIEMHGVWTEAGGKDEKGNILNDDEMVFNSYINGYLVDPTYDPGGGISRDKDNSDDLWTWDVSPEMRLLNKDGSVHDYVKLRTESYAINNSGTILNLKNFTSTSENPFTLLKEVAAEQIIFCGKRDGTSFFTRGNLDLVFTPDLAIAIAEKLATQVGDISKSGNSDSDSQSK
jgi:hypothetical protein